jgi:hypothetical protein
MLVLARLAYCATIVGYSCKYFAELVTVASFVSITAGNLMCGVVSLIVCAV